jgi:hypothetical protein
MNSHTERRFRVPSPMVQRTSVCITQRNAGSSADTSEPSGSRRIVKGPARGGPRRPRQPDLPRRAARLLTQDRRLRDRHPDDVTSDRCSAAHRDRPPVSDRDRGRPRGSVRSKRYQRTPCAHGLTGSMGRVSSAGDNAAMESSDAAGHLGLFTWGHLGFPALDA